MIFSNTISFILRFRLAILVVLGLVVLGGLTQTARQLTVNNSLSIWFLDNNPKYQSYLAFQEAQGSDQIVVAMLAVDSLYTPTDFEKLNRLHTALDSLPFVNTTLSLANLKYPLYANKKIVYRDFYGADRSSDWMNGLLKDLPNVRRQLVSEDGNYTFFYCQLAPGNVIEQDRRAYVSRIETLIRQTLGPVHITGPPIINEAYSQTIYEESSFFAATTVVVIVVLLLFLLPHWIYLPIALATVAVTIGITLGLLTSLGYSLNLISMLIPTILMVYAISDTIHIINIFHAHRNAHPEQGQAAQIIQALRSSLKPCFYTTLTTVIGYLALSLSPLPAFRVTGLFTFLGILIAFFAAYLITAIGFSYLPKEPLKGKIKKINIQGLVAHINYWTGTYNTRILVAAVVCFVLGIVGLFFIDVNTNSLHLLGKGVVKDDLQLIEQTLEGSARLQLTLSRLDEQNMLSRADLNKMRAFQDSLSQLALLAHPISILDFQDFMEARLSSLARLQRINLEKVLTNSEPQDNNMFSLVSDDYAELSININIRELQTKDLERLLAHIKGSFQHHFSSTDYQLTINGFPAVYAQLNHFILQTQFRSFGAAFLIAFGILFYFLGDLKTAILALVPNLLPLCITVVVMWLWGIDLEAANAMLAPIMIGVSMDDTIHLMNKYQLNRQAGMPVGESIDQALVYTGGALLSTTIALVGGFLVVGASGVISVATFGLLCAFTILV
ncbi:MAG: MMPL family transporter, partial [Bacteroidota bacterium]